MNIENHDNIGLNNYDKVCKILLDWEDHAHSASAPEHTSKEEWARFNKARAARKRKFGLASKADSIWKPKKRRRVKAYQTIMQINNMLKVSANVSLAFFARKPNYDVASECPASAFDWEHLDLAPDMGPDMICAEHALTYHKKLNVTANWDIDHCTSNTGKQALKKSGLWATAILVASANNAMYGSALRISFI